MEVILLERVAKLGQIGDVVRVKDGYARNFLLPQKLAQQATRGAQDQVDRQKATEAKREERELADARALAVRLEAAWCVSAHYWMSIQADYEIALARERGVDVQVDLNRHSRYGVKLEDICRLDEDWEGLIRP